jgi:hypothetical protein
MLIKGSDFHARYQQIAMMDETIGGVGRATAGPRERRSAADGPCLEWVPYPLRLSRVRCFDLCFPSHFA